MAKGLDADVDCTHEATDFFLARPRASTRGRRDDLDRRSDSWMFILAGFRSRDDLACSYRRAGRNVPVEGNERRLCLHPCAIRRLDNSLARGNRRQVPPLKCNRKRASAAPRLLSSGECGDLGGDA